MFTCASRTLILSWSSLRPVSSSCWFDEAGLLQAVPSRHLAQSFWRKGCPRGQRSVGPSGPVLAETVGCHAVPFAVPRLGEDASALRLRGRQFPASHFGWPLVAFLA